MLFKRCFLVSLWLSLLFIGSNAQDKYYIKRVDFGDGEILGSKIQKAARVIPERKQYEWQKLEMTAFVHFGINTFTGREWGDGTEKPELFNPTQFDANQWVKTLKDGGMKMVIITAKHHDGFCLWPTKTTLHSVASSPWRNGEGDVVKEVKKACETYGLKFGIYLSPWDRNAECYGNSPVYNEFFLLQLTELLTWYGKIDEVWFDGANGEGPNGRKQIYDWQAYYDKIKELQPDAVVAIMGEDIRWVGTETGYGRETEWSVTALAPGGTLEMKTINRQLGINAQSEDLGSRELIEKAEHLFWYPAEVDVSIRPGWFYHENENDKVKSLVKMVDIYFNSVGLNAVLLLNIPPDKRGLIHENDASRLQEFKAFLDKMYASNLMQDADFSKEVQSQIIFSDNCDEVVWKSVDIPATVEAILPYEKTFNVIMIQEEITKGQRVERFRVEVWNGDQWEAIASSTTIGYKKLLRVPKITTSKIRLVIEEARDNAIISKFALFLAPEILSDPVITRNKGGFVSITTETLDPVITYTLDGSDPLPTSPKYTKPFLFPKGGIVKACAFINNFSEKSSVITKKFYTNKSKWEVISKSDELTNFPASNAIDDDETTMWHTHWETNMLPHPHHITVDLGEKLKVKGLYYLPRSGDNKSGTVFKYSFYLSSDGNKWEQVVDHGEFSNIAHNPVLQIVEFDESYYARYFKFVTHQGAYNEEWISVGEIGIINDK